MPKAWSEVAGSSEFKALPPDQQETARGQYFDQIVAPQVPDDQRAAARQQFDASTKATPQTGSTEKAIGEDWSKGVASAKAGINKFPYGGAGDLLIGASEMAGAPFTGFARATVGDPGREALAEHVKGMPHGTEKEQRNRAFISLFGEAGVNTAEQLTAMAAPGVLGKGLALAAPKVGEAVTSGAAEVSKALDDRAALKLREAAQKIVLGAGDGKAVPAALKEIEDARAAGKPMVLADFPDVNEEGLAGRTARAAGPGRTIAADFLGHRDVGAGQRLVKDVTSMIGSGSTRATERELAAERTALGRPLFDEAYRGGSMAPLERRFEMMFWDAVKGETAAAQDVQKAQQALTVARGKMSSTPSDFSHLDTRNPHFEDARLAEQDVARAERKLQDARQEGEAIRTRLREAQADGSANAPGAVWSPNIQRMLDTPEVRAGIRKGVQIERLRAVNEGKAFDPTEFAIVGTDATGEPIVGKVPNMRLLASAKEGLDDLLNSKEMRDELMPWKFNKRGAELNQLRKGLLRELDAANPTYAKARQLWASESESVRALQFGQNLFSSKNTPEYISEIVEGMTPGERDYARVGLAEELRTKIYQTGLNGDEAKHILNSEWARMQVRPFFDSDEGARKFIDAVAREKTMFETRGRLTGGSPSAQRLEEGALGDMGIAMRGIHVASQAASGHFGGAVHSLLAVRRELGMRNNPKLNEAVAKLLFDPEITPQKLGLPPSTPAMKAPPATSGSSAASVAATLGVPPP